MRSLAAIVGWLPSCADICSWSHKSFRIRRRVLHLTWWFIYTHSHHNWQTVVVYFEAGIRGCVRWLWVAAKNWDSDVMWPQLLSPHSDCSLEAQPKYVRGGKRYGRRSLPEFQESVEEFAEVTVIEPLDEEARPSHIPASDCSEVRSWACTFIRITSVEPYVSAGQRQGSWGGWWLDVGFSQLPTPC